MHCVKTEDPGGKWRCKLHHPLILNKNNILTEANLSPNQKQGQWNPQSREHCYV